jgi:hypothetical protein
VEGLRTNGAIAVGGGGTVHCEGAIVAEGAETSGGIAGVGFAAGTTLVGITFVAVGGARSVGQDGAKMGTSWAALDCTGFLMAPRLPAYFEVVAFAFAGGRGLGVVPDRRDRGGNMRRSTRAVSAVGCGVLGAT